MTKQVHVHMLDSSSMLGRINRSSAYPSSYPGSGVWKNPKGCSLMLSSGEEVVVLYQSFN
jgi:hypothetical protein